MDEKTIEAFWDAHPCGEHQVETSTQDMLKFFDDYDKFRYEVEAHILGCLDGLDIKGKTLLEIGLGQASDSEQLIHRGAIWSGLDLTPTAIERAQTRMELKGINFDEIKQGTILDAPFPDNSFDVVFSHGVLHHVPEVKLAQQEIARILKPDGELIVMLYAKWSLNYLLAIHLIRRIGLAGLMVLNKKPDGMLGDHVRECKKTGFWNYIKMDNFVHRNTDGPHNPYSKVYDRALIAEDFPDFEITKIYKRHMHAPPLPVHGLPGGSIMGWHLWVHMRQRNR